MRQIFRDMRFWRYMLPAAAVAVMATGCTNDENLDVETGFGVAMNISFNDGSSTRSDDAFDYSLALENSVLKIYDEDDRLLRRYEPISEVPDYIYLTEGDYYVTVVAGESVSPTEEREDITFMGESSFTVKSSVTTSISISCPMINNVMNVVLDSSLTDNLEEGYTLIVAQANEISDDVFEENYLYRKVFTEEGTTTTYFIQPTDIDNIVWKFEGVLKSTSVEEDSETDSEADSENDSESSDSESDSESDDLESDEEELTKSSSEVTIISKTGIIEDVAAGESNSLIFSYEKQLEVNSLNVTVDTSEESYNDIFEFSPQPTVLGIDFNIADTQVASGDDFKMNIDGIYELMNVAVSYDGVSISPFVNGVAASEAEGGVSFSLTNEKSGVLTISNDYFSTIGAGGDQTIEIKVSDIKSATTNKEFYVTTTGVAGFSDVDFWYNSGKIMATIVDDAIDPSKVAVEYRTKGNSDWISYSLSQEDGYLYSAQSSPVWSSAQKNADGLTYYTPEEGLFPSTEYECRLVVDGVARPTTTITSDATSQAITNGNMNSTSLSCWGTSNSSTTTWGSGNNSYTSSLCKQATVGGALCAKLETTESFTVVAAGNIFYAQFTFASFTGTVKFGQPFTWTARPRSLKVKYAASLASGSLTAPSGTTDAGTTYSNDRARVFLAIVDWSSRHTVSASTSTATGIWDPASQTSTDEGKIIGYASIFIDEDTTLTELHQMDIPIHYYDTATKPSGDYTIVISAASSAYGDYKVGVKGSILYLDDFEFGY